MNGQYISVNGYGGRIIPFFLRPIVEKSNTHLGDFMYRNCTVKEQEYLRNAIQTLVQQ